MAQFQPNPPLLLDSLYCQEDHWDNNEAEESYVFEEAEESYVFEEAEESYVFEEAEESYVFEEAENSKNGFILTEQDYFWEEEELSSLFSKEEQHEGLCCDLGNNPFLAESRAEAVDWMLKVVAHYSFSARTAVLAVNYFDRFGFSFQFQRDKPWMTQLVAVSCLSLAAKVEETRVPLLLDLQVEETKYVFEAKTIKRMEILVLSTLKWKMNPVTPLSFLDYITRRLGLKSTLSFVFLKRSESLLLTVLADYRFVRYLPSIVAAATMLLLVNSLEPCIGGEYETQLFDILNIDKGKVKDCYLLIEELTSSELGRNLKKRKFGSFPYSPKGVMDLPFCSDNSNDSWSVTSSAPASVPSSPEPATKKCKVQDQHMQSLGNTSADILSIPI